MSGERGTLETRFVKWLQAGAVEPGSLATDEIVVRSLEAIAKLADLTSQEIEAIHAMYRPRIERLESEIERLTQDLETVRALAMSRGPT